MTVKPRGVAGGGGRGCVCPGSSSLPQRDPITAPFPWGFPGGLQGTEALRGLEAAAPEG